MRVLECFVLRSTGKARCKHDATICTMVVQNAFNMLQQQACMCVHVLLWAAASLGQQLYMYCKNNRSAGSCVSLTAPGLNTIHMTIWELQHKPQAVSCAPCAWCVHYMLTVLDTDALSAN